MSFPVVTGSRVSSTVEKKQSIWNNIPRGRRRTVRFCKPIVTDVREIPFMLPEDLGTFYYSENDISRFRVAMISKRKKKVRRKRIKFCDDVVSEIRYIPRINEEDVAKFFFTEKELEEILQEFVSSATSE